MPYWCFGESAWGYQYAYLVQELNGAKCPRVYRHDGFVAELVAPSFEGFLEMLARRYKADGFEMTVQHELGPLRPKTNLIYLPPTGLLPHGGEYDIANIKTMDAQSAMICNGDANIQLEDAPDGATPTGYTVYTDTKGRTRLQISWARAGTGS